MAKEQKTIVCRERDPDCDWEARDSDEAELIFSAQAHLKRRHGIDLGVEQLRPRVAMPRRGVGGI